MPVPEGEDPSVAPKQIEDQEKLEKSRSILSFILKLREVELWRFGRVAWCAERQSRAPFEPAARRPAAGMGHARVRALKSATRLKSTGV